MARLLGTDTSTCGTYEAGLQRIRADQALKLSTYGIPLDWVYDGKVANLHPHIRAKIRELANHEEREGTEAAVARSNATKPSPRH